MTDTAPPTPAEVAELVSQCKAIPELGDIARRLAMRCDRLEAENERLRGTVQWVQKQIVKPLEALQAVEADAAKWDYVRRNLGSIAGGQQNSPVVDALERAWAYGTQPDAAIDALMAPEECEHNPPDRSEAPQDPEE